MFRIAIKTLRRRKGGFLATLLALFVGAVIVQGCGALLETGIVADVAPQRLAAAPVVVTGNQNYPGSPVGDDTDAMTERVLLNQNLVAAVAKIPGVTSAVPDVSVPITSANGQDLAGSGLAWSTAPLSPYQLTSGAAPASSGDVVVDSGTASKLGLHPGSALALGVRGNPENFQVSGIVQSANASNPALFFTDSEATALFDRPGKIDDIAVLAAPGTDASALADKVQAVVGSLGAQALYGDQRGRAEFPDSIAGSQNLIPLSAAFGGLATMVAIFVVGSIVGLLMQQRRREMALMRTVGLTPGQLRRMVMVETAVIAVLAAALSIYPGVAFGRIMYSFLVNQGLIPGVMVYTENFIPKLVGFGVTLVASLAAAFISSRRVSKVRPTEALAEATLQTRWVSPIRIILAVLFLGGAFALAIVTATVMTGPVAASTSTPAAMLWAVGVALVAPGLCRWIAALLNWPIRSFTGLSGRLAMLNARVRKVRLAAAVTPIMLVTGLATALIYLQTSQDAAANQMFVNSLKADAVVSSTTSALPPSLVDQLANLPQVSGVSASASSEGHIETQLGPGEDEDGNQVQSRVEPTTIALQGVTGSGAPQVLNDKLVQGDYANLTGNSIVLPTDMLSSTVKGVGSTVTLRWGDGEASTMTVVGTFTPPRGFDTALVPVTALLAHTTTGELPQILVKGKAGVSSADLTAALHTATAGLSGAVVADRATATAQYAQSDSTNRVASYLLAAVVVGYAVIALINSLIVATVERRREFALQRLIGSTRGQVMRMMSVEALITALVGIVLGIVVAAGSLVPFGIALDGQVLPSGPGWIFAVILIAAVGLTFLTILFPTSVALRTAPVEAASPR